MEKFIYELDSKELKTLLENNEDIYRKYWRDCLDSIGFWFDSDVLAHFNSVLNRNYEFGYCGCWLNIRECDYKEFIGCCKKIIDSGFCLFSDGVAGLIDRAAGKCDFWDDCYNWGGVSDNTWDNFSKWFEKIVNAAVDEILEYARAEFDLPDDIDYLTDYVFNNCECENIVINTDDWTAYETITRNYA